MSYGDFWAPLTKAVNKVVSDWREMGTDVLSCA